MLAKKPTWLALLIAFSLACKLVQPPAAPTSPPAGKSPPLTSVAATGGPAKATGQAAKATRQSAASPDLPAATLEPSPTPEPSLTPEPAIQLQEAYRQVAASPDWPPQGLSAEQQAAWADFAAGKAELASDEQEALQAFVDRWNLLHSLAGQRVPVDAAAPAWQVVEVPGPQAGQSLPVLVATGDKGQIYIVARDRDGHPKALLLTPEIPSLSQRISADGNFVEYVDAKGNWLLRADGHALDPSDRQEALLLDMMTTHDARQAYQEGKVLPRYQVNLPGVPANFYLLENMTFNQIQLLISTLQVFDRPEFAGIKPYIFLPGDEAPFLLTNQPDPNAAAMAYRLGGQPPRGLMLIFTRNVFHSKYETASGIAHEAAHIWQGEPNDCDHPQDRLRDEIGAGTIPRDLYSWTPDQLYAAVQQHAIGAYHLSLWVAARFNIADEIDFYRRIITTGSNDGQSLINCGK